jgi:hypothetical protein
LEEKRANMQGLNMLLVVGMVFAISTIMETTSDPGIFVA